MKKAIIAACMLCMAGTATFAEPKISKETVVLSTQDAADKDDNWAGAALTFIVFLLIFAGAGTPAPS